MTRSPARWTTTGSSLGIQLLKRKGAWTMGYCRPLLPWIVDRVTAWASESSRMTRVPDPASASSADWRSSQVTSAVRLGRPGADLLLQHLARSARRR